MRSMLTALPSAVNFPTLHYQTGQSGVVKVDFSVLDMMAYLRVQSKRYIRYAQQEAAVIYKGGGGGEGRVYEKP
jgi:hypothetical protein